MAAFGMIEKKIIYRLFGIGSGYIFSFFSNDGYNKNDTRDIIWDSCGINIYNNDDYKDLSQQKCVEKIFNSNNNTLIANLLQGMCDYFCFKMGSSFWGDEDQNDYSTVQKIIERLKSSDSIDLPNVSDIDNIELLVADIEKNMQENKPELAIDRLHTYTAYFIQSLCKKHDINIKKENGEFIPIDGLMANLKKLYIDEGYLDTEFSKTAIKTSISLFEKFNNIRNNKSYAHPNELLNKIEAQYAIDIIIPTLKFIEQIEEQKDASNDIIEEMPF